MRVQVWCRSPDNGLPLQVRGEAWVRELCGPCGMVHKIWPALRGVPYLPSLGQLAQCLRVHLHIAVPRVVPSAGPCCPVHVVHLALSSHALLCKEGWGPGQGRAQSEHSLANHILPEGHGTGGIPRCK